MTRSGKRTKARAEAVERELEAADKQGRVLAVAALEKYLSIFCRLSEVFAPGTSERPNKHADLQAFERWSKMGIRAAEILAQYQAPRLASMMVPAPTVTEKTTRFTLAIFERDHTGQRRRVEPGVCEPPVIDGEVAENVVDAPPNATEKAVQPDEPPAPVAPVVAQSAGQVFRFTAQALRRAGERPRPSIAE